MLKKTITFKDLDGNDVTEDFYFNLSKAELAEMSIRSHGKQDLAAYLKQIVEAENGEKLMDLFKQIITMSIGKRSEDGRRFIKNDEVTNEFLQSDAYSVFFIEIVTDAEAAAEYIRGVVPADMSEKIDVGKPVTDLSLPNTTEEEPAWIRENREPTQAEVQTMTPEQLRDAFMRKSNSGGEK